MSFDRKISLVVLVLIVLGLISIIYLMIYPIHTTGYTNFYILGTEGKATNYPVNMSTGETGKVIVGVVNHEHQTVKYSLIVKMANSTVLNENVTLKNEETKEIPLNFTVTSPGKLELFLYKLPDTEKTYSYLFLDING